jgi:rhomboid protease GluP
MTRTKRIPTPATYAIMAAILVAAALQYFDNAKVLGWGANVSYRYIDGEYWRLLASMFLHGGVAHLGVNLFGLYQLGTLYEAMFGTRRFLLIYFVAGVAASITSMMHMPP